MLYALNEIQGRMKKDTKVDINPTKQEMKFNTLRKFLGNEAQC